MVYRLHDEAGTVLYVGRSCDVRQRLRAHESEARWHPTGGPERAAEKAAWFYRSRRVSMVGPFTWDESCRVERVEIETHQPVGNRQFTKAHGYRPLTEGGGQYVGRKPHP
jgi:hypothetical protein